MKPKNTTDQRQLKKRLSHLLKQNANKKCAECPEKRPTWCSLIKPHPEAPLGSKTLAAFICFQCAGIHRKLGTHICFVRSVSLDDWTETEVETAEESGNEVVNIIYEDNLRKMKSDNPAGATDVNIKPLQGAHAATRERYIRQKYIELDFYSKNAHYQHLSGAHSSPAMTPKSPGIRKKLGIFLNKDKSPGATTKMLNGTKSVCSSTVETTPSDAKSFFSAPTRITRDQFKAHLIARGSQSVCPQPTARQQTKMKIKGGDASTVSETIGSGQSTILTAVSTDIDTSDENVGMNDALARKKSGNNHLLRTGSNHSSMVLKKPEIHTDPRRSAFQNSRGSLNVSMDDLLNSDEELEVGAGNGNNRPGKDGKRRPSLLSTNIAVNPSPRNSRVKLYSQRSSRGRSRSNSRAREDPLDGEKQRHRTRSSSRLRDGENGVLTSSSGGNQIRDRRARSRSINRTNVPSDVAKKQRNRSSSRARDLNSSNRLRERSRSNSELRRSKSDDIDGLGRVAHIIRKGESNLGRLDTTSKPRQSVNNLSERYVPDRSQIEDLSGMILVFDESCSNFDSDGEPLTSQGRGRRGSSRRPHAISTELSKERGHSSTRARSRSRSETCGRRNGTSELETSARRDSSRSRSRGRPSSRSFTRNESVEISPLRPSSSRSRSRKTSSRSLADAEADGVEISPTGQNCRSASRRQISRKPLSCSSPSLATSPVPAGARRRSRSGARNSERQLEDTKLLSESPRGVRITEADQDSDAKGQMTIHRTVRSSETQGQKRDESKETTERQLNPSLEAEGQNKKTNSGAPHQQHSCRDGSTVHVEAKQRRSANFSRNSSRDRPDGTLASPKNSGEKDFQVIASNSFALGAKGSNNPMNGSFNKAYHSHGPKESTAGTERPIKENRRFSRDKMAAMSRQRQARKSDIFASLDREQNEVGAQEGPLVQMPPRRSKSSNIAVGEKGPLMIRPASHGRSKSSDRIQHSKSKPNLKLPVTLVGGKYNEVPVKTWAQRKAETETDRQLADFESSVMEFDV